MRVVGVQRRASMEQRLDARVDPPTGGIVRPSMATGPGPGLLSRVKGTSVSDQNPPEPPRPDHEPGATPPPEQPAFGGPPPSGQGSGPTAAVTPSVPPPTEPAPAPPPASVSSTGAYSGGASFGGPGSGGPYAGGPGPAPAQGLTTGVSSGSGGFLEALFDYGFNSFVTPKIVKFVYVLATVWVVIVYALSVFSGFAQSVGYGIAVLVIGPIFALIWLAIVRIGLEFAISVVRMSEDVHKRLPQA